MKQNIMQHLQGSYGGKIILIGALCICFIAPLSMVRSIIAEREHRSSSVKRELISSWGGNTEIAGPYLTVPVYRQETVYQSDGSKRIEQTKKLLLVFPELLDARIDAKSETRSRGIYIAPLYLADLQLQGHFKLNGIEDQIKEGEFAWDEAKLVLHLGRLRGIREVQEARARGVNLSFEPATELSEHWGDAIAAPLDLSDLDKNGGSFPYSIRSKMGGGGEISMIPVAQNSSAEIISDWSSPSFQGSPLPDTRDYSEEGFHATWKISHLGRNLPKQVFLGEFYETASATSSFGVHFFQEDDPYPKNQRSVKYAWLFLIVPFITFFLFEVIRKTPIHPVQYLLAGSADMVFYLLLVSISEQIPFLAAYLVSSAAIILLLGAYGSTVLGGRRSGALLATILAVAYGYLYFVLQSEDYALLLGSLGLFLVLAALMYLTRNVSWYRRD